MQHNGDVEPQLKIAFIQRKLSINICRQQILCQLGHPDHRHFLAIFICGFFFYLPNITSVNPPVKHWYVAAEMSCTYDSLSSGESPKIFSVCLHFVVELQQLGVCIRDPSIKIEGLNSPNPYCILDLVRTTCIVFRTYVFSLVFF